MTRTEFLERIVLEGILKNILAYLKEHKGILSATCN